MNLPDAFAQQMSHLLGQEWSDFEAALHAHSVRGVRVHRFATGQIPNYIGKHLGNPIPWSPFGYYVDDDTPFPKTVYHEVGALYLQEPSAMAAAVALRPQPGERILDLCAAPGSKTTFIAALMDSTCQLVANEIHKGRVSVLAENIERMGVTAAITNRDPEHLADIWQTQFDAILVDAPCSGEGMFRKSAVAFEQWQPDSPDVCARRQRSILTSAVQMLRPGGRILYSTCTFNPVENEQMVAWMEDEFGFVTQPIQDLPGWSAGRPDWADGRASLLHTRRCWPHLTIGEGHFLACLVKPGDSTRQNVVQTAQEKNLPIKWNDEWPDFLHEHFALSPEEETHWSQTVMHKDIIFRNGLIGLRTDGIRVLRPGTALAVLEKGRITPHHALALSIPPRAFRSVKNVDENDAIRYLRGETLTKDTSLRGFVGVNHEGLTLGFAKGVEGRFNNLYPKGKRRSNLVPLQP